MLVMIIPLFEILTFPQHDYALKTWTERMSLCAYEDDPARYSAELQKMVEFFKEKDYGPFNAWKGDCDGVIPLDAPSSEEKLKNRTCTLVDGDVWNPVVGPPQRQASVWLVYTQEFMIAFNMQSPTKVEAGLTMLNIGFVIFIMVFSGLTLSSVVTELAVRPLERMLTTVREIATTVFKFSHEVAEDDEEEIEDIDSASEMKLLEKVVNKLATIASLTAAKQVENIEDMQEEDIGVLNMMQGKNIVEEKARHERMSRAIGMGAHRKRQMVSLKFEDIGMTQDVYQSWSFNTLTLTKEQRMKLAFWTISQYHEPMDGFICGSDDEATLTRFVAACEKEYLANPFHNFAHAVDVLHGVGRLMRIICADDWLVPLEQFALLISALGHDCGHPGVNNGFLSEVGHELALQYNDRSPLENMHCARLYQILSNKETNVFAKLTKEQYKVVRKHCIEMILHTDMMGHNAMVKDLQMLFQMNSEIFAPPEQANGLAISSNVAELEVFGNADTKVLLMDCILHSADVSNPCRAWPVTEAWAVCCLEEFFAQGDQEKVLGIPVQFLNDRDKLNRPNSQIGFIEFMIAPFFAAQIRLWPSMHELGDNLGNNIEKWFDKWVAETSPASEDKAKVEARVNRVKDSMEDAKYRGVKPVA
eukprot:gnl/TRDRNA2_/TRDRNA2_170462_c1_seq3.p1 gnl/TRDRNA2_/TRDRNA2_170462_c1~~gnl/TRDRNA2_/TRDRNA2_170462_c1_seq3.p1  ORF type:complete len:707 (-),score=157.45 gnl/TRDRNA2_/TRDRNA2_170462_c1_seq3:439-2373(-)